MRPGRALGPASIEADELPVRPHRTAPARDTGPVTSSEARGPEVSTRAGRVRGLWRGGSAAFLGIPFAEPPRGPLRFAAPVPHAAWPGVRDATAHGATPFQGDAGITLIPEPTVPGDDTLDVDVFTPDPSPRARLPVLVYIHGGGYTSGTPASPWYDGRSFNRDGVVTVSVSYRLGFEGFGWIDDAPQNRGVLDWLLALEWVQENIEAFGGDPDRVTIAGQSAGGGAVMALLALPRAQHLFRAVWCMSGAISTVGADRARAVSSRLAAAAGVPADRSGFESVAPERTLALQRRATTGRPGLSGALTLLDAGLPLGPTVDGDLIERPVTEAIAAGIGADKALVLGSTDDEFSMLLDARRALLRVVPPGAALALLRVPAERRRRYLAAVPRSRRERGTAGILGGYVTDMVFRREVVRIARARGAAPTWTYRFAWPSPAFGWALHCLDVPFFFDCLGAEQVDRIAGDAPPQSLADAVHGAAVRFVTEGDPGWTPWRPAGTSRVFEVSGPAETSDAYAAAAMLA